MIQSFTDNLGQVVKALVNVQFESMWLLACLAKILIAIVSELQDAQTSVSTSIFFYVQTFIGNRTLFYLFGTNV